MKKFIAVFACLAFMASSANAVVILSNNAGTSTLGGSGYEGHSFTMPVGNNYKNITFSWISSDQQTLLAAGNLFILTQEYLSSPDQLSSSTPGFVAESTHVASDAYVFDGNVTLQAGVQYWVYMGAEASLAGGGFTFSDPFAGGQAYEQFGSASGNYFNNGAGLDFNFVLSGDVAPVPEPSTYVLFALGLLGLGMLRRRSKS